MSTGRVTLQSQLPLSDEKGGIVDIHGIQAKSPIRPESHQMIIVAMESIRQCFHRTIAYCHLHS
jgi:hypothetical protein